MIYQSVLEFYSGKKVTMTFKNATLRDAFRMKAIGQLGRLKAVNDEAPGIVVYDDVANALADALHFDKNEG